MEYVKFGNTGVDVSKLCLGCMSFGSSEGWIHNKWALTEEESRSIIKKSLELGINFFDTANVYANGVSEEILGKAIKDFGNRDEVVIATKLFSKMHDGPNGMGLSRKAILSEIDRSLKRLDMDYVDIYIIHRWDYNTPIEETMEALHDVIKSGKARYIGASSMYAWQFQKALYTSEKNGWSRFVSMQNHMNLIYREEEREMIPLCRNENIAITPYSPLASGRLARDWSETSKRLETDSIAKIKYGSTTESDRLVVERLTEIAKKYNVSHAQIALAWLMQKQPVTIPVIGATKLSHIENLLPAISIKLEAEDVLFMEEPYVPHQIIGHN